MVLFYLYSSELTVSGLSRLTLIVDGSTLAVSSILNSDIRHLILLLKIWHD